MEYICSDCPRKCYAFRSDDISGGICASPALPLIARAAPHFGEEPCISGEHGSGAIFFSGCNLKCVFCQNREISRGKAGECVDAHRLRDIMFALRDKGVHNINLVTASHYVPVVEKALNGLELGIPVVWNSSGYESVETLKRLEGLVQVYMPDFKYSKGNLAKLCSAAEDYPAVAAAAIREMFRQRGKFRLDKNGMLVSGVLIRHLILPGQTLNSMDVIDFVAEEFEEDDVLFSLMGQYTPMGDAVRLPELGRRLSDEENENMCSYMLRRGITNGYWQDTAAAGEEEIPAFDGTGLR